MTTASHCSMQPLTPPLHPTQKTTLLYPISSSHNLLQPAAHDPLMSPHTHFLHTHAAASSISLTIQLAPPPRPSSSQLKRGLLKNSSAICKIGAVGACPPGCDADTTSAGQNIPLSNIIPSCFLQANSLISRISSSPHRAARLTQLASTLCNALENLIPTILQHSNTDLIPMDAMQGNFAPVADECPPQDCILDERYGPLPSFLEGIYVRNGPNEQYKSRAAPTHSSHPFDGDGMLHSVSFLGGKTTYSCRYVHTNRFLQEKAAGQPLFPKIFSCLTIKDNYIATAHMCLAALRHMLGLIDLTKGMGLANTSVVFHHGKLLALGEDDLPYAIRIENNGNIINKGRYTFSGNGILPKTMTSHPKIDPVTGEMIFLSYNAFLRPYLTFFRMSPDGMLSKPVPISLQEPSMIHDFAITPHYIIFPETKLVLHPLHMLKGKAPIKCDRRKVQRFGVLPRDAVDDSALRWFDVPGCNCFHIFNSWEEPAREGEEQHNIIGGDVKEIVLILPNCSSPEDLLEGRFNKMKNILTEVRLNLAEGEATQREMKLAAGGEDDMNVDMGTMNENYRGVKNRYVYMGRVSGGSSTNVLSGLVKVDFKTGDVVAHRRFDEDCYASEPVFVPSLPPSAYINSTELAEEDEGIILCMLHRESQSRRDDSTTENIGDAESCSWMLVLDARSATLDTIASIKLPRRVPYGFHGLFIPNSSYNSRPTL